MAETTATVAFATERIVNDILATIDREREREIVSRRFGLFDRKETLEQIGELLGITRERVRQLEKSVITRLRHAAEQGEVPHVTEVQDRLEAAVEELGGVARVGVITTKLGLENTRVEQSRVAFLAQLCPHLIVINDDDHYHHSIAVLEHHDEKTLKERVGGLM